MAFFPIIVYSFMGTSRHVSMGKYIFSIARLYCLKHVQYIHIYLSYYYFYVETGTFAVVCRKYIHNLKQQFHHNFLWLNVYYWMT